MKIGKWPSSRRLIFRVRDEKELRHLIEALQDVQRKIRTVTLTMRTKLDEVRITFTGDPITVQEAVREARRVISEIKYEGRRDSKGFYSIPLTSLARANLEVAIPIALLVKLLEIKGYEAYIKGEHIKSKAPSRTVIENARALSKAYKEAMSFPLTSSARRLIALYSTLSCKRVNEVVNELLREGFLDKRKDGSITLTKNFNTVLEILKERLKGVSSGG
ncbi:MAG: hypothetical protein B6U69_03835 [Thermofilum sp. ex4484_15]|nr:MAG: hypothetical protein B6U69_03835 [Thermofilum sp. ex4484_15]